MELSIWSMIKKCHIDSTCVTEESWTFLIEEKEHNISFEDVSQEDDIQLLIKIEKILSIDRHCDRSSIEKDNTHDLWI